MHAKTYTKMSSCDEVVAYVPICKHKHTSMHTYIHVDVCWWNDYMHQYEMAHGAFVPCAPHYFHACICDRMLCIKFETYIHNRMRYSLETCIQTCVRTCKRSHTHACMYACMHTCMLETYPCDNRTDVIGTLQLCKAMWSGVRPYIKVCMYTCVCVCVYIYIYIYIYIYACM